MQYRPLEARDVDRHIALESYAFRAEPDRSRLDAAAMGRRRGLFDGETLVAQLELLALRVRTGAGEVAAAGIAGVASAPETRRRGHIDTLLNHLYAELREAGVALGILFPFKASFYGRHGWATFYERKLYSGAPARFAPFKAGPGGFVPAGEAEIAELDRIYTGALRGRFGPIVRDEAWWRERLLRNYYEGHRHHAFIWRDEQGHGRSYLIFRVEGGRDSALLCQDIVALDPTARAQLFAFLAGHQDQVKTVRFPAPADAPVNLLFPDPLDCAVEPRFMLRLLDVRTALEAYTYPADAAGRLTLAVRDDWIPDNQGVYELELVNRRCAVRRLADDAPADLACDVRVLAQLYSRLLRPHTAAAFGVLEAHDRAALDLAARAFAGLAPYSSDFF